MATEEGDNDKLLNYSCLNIPDRRSLFSGVRCNGVLIHTIFGPSRNKIKHWFLIIVFTQVYCLLKILIHKAIKMSSSIFVSVSKVKTAMPAMHCTCRSTDFRSENACVSLMGSEVLCMLCDGYWVLDGNVECSVSIEIRLTTTINQKSADPLNSLALARAISVYPWKVSKIRISFLFFFWHQ